MHFKAENLRISKHPQLSIVAQNLKELRPPKQRSIFFWDNLQIKILDFTCLGRHHVEASKWQTKNFDTYFIKWTITGEPPVGSKYHWYSYFWSNKQKLSDYQYGTPCMYYYCITMYVKSNFKGFKTKSINLQL